MKEIEQTSTQDRPDFFSAGHRLKTRHELWRAGLYFVGIVLLFFREPLLYPAHFHIPYDLEGYHNPLSNFIAWSLREFHHLPWWNPYSYMGQPFFGNTQAAIFYPPTLITIAIGNIFVGRLPFYFLEWQLAFHVMLAGVGTFILLRNLNLAFWSSLAGGTIYSLGGFFASQTQHLGVISAAAWLPWFVAGLLRLEQRRDLKSAGIAGLPLALMILPGFPAGYLPVFVLAPLLYVLWMWQRRSEPRSRTNFRALALLALAFALGMAMSAVSWLPAYGISKQSAATQRPTAQAIDGIPMEAATSFFWPNLFGQLGTDYHLRENPTFLHLYQGIPALLLILAGAGGMIASHRARPFIAVCLLALFWMFGTALFVSEVMYLLYPYFVRRGVYPQYVFAYFCLFLSVLVAMSLNAYERGERPTLFKDRFIWSAALGCILIALLVSAFSAITQSEAHSAAAPAFMLLWIAFVLGTCGFLSRGPALLPSLTVNHGSAAVCFLIALDLIVVGSSTHLNTSGDAHVESFPAVQFMRQQLGPHPLYRIDTSGLWTEWQTRNPEWRIPSANGMDPLLLLITEKYRQPFSRVSGRQFKLTSIESPLLDLAGIRYIVTRANQLGNMPRVYHNEVDIFENKRAFQRFFLVGTVVSAPDIGSAVQSIENYQVDPATVAVVPAEDAARFTGLTVPADSAALGTVELLSESPNQLRLRVNSSKAAVLVATETFWKDWHATIDGTALPITPADGIFRAIPVPAGVHEVRMFIVPITIYVAAGVSMLGLVVSLMLIVAPRFLNLTSTSLRSTDR